MMRGTVQRQVQQNAGYGQKVSDKDQATQKVPELVDLVKQRDFRGAITLLRFIRQKETSSKNNEWLAYCLFHAGEYLKALQIYDGLMKAEEADPELNTYAAACHFYNGNYKEAQSMAAKGSKSNLQNRILFHCVHAIGDEDELLQYHGKLTTSTEDQLSLAAIHFRRSHFQEATDIYKRILLEHKDYSALNIYIALCYSRLDYYDVSQDILKQYMAHYPDSLLAINLKACNTFRISDGRKAEQELQAFKAQNSTSIQDNDLIRHNLVVFRGGENAMRDLVPLVGLIPEARLNLVIYYLRKGETQPAFDLMKDIEPTQPQEYILKGVVHAVLGQAKNDAEHLKYAQQYFQLVGASASECDTIPGRQCMASCFFLLKQFDDVLIFLNSIRQYFLEDDDYNWNYAIALANVGKYEDVRLFHQTLLLQVKAYQPFVDRPREAIKAFTSVKSESYRKDFCFASWLARCYINTKKPQEAWKLYLRMEMSDDSYNMLHLIANECYAMGQFFYSAKAFQVLERLDPDEKYFEGKRGACIGYMQLVTAGEESGDRFSDILNIMKDSTNPHAATVIPRMKQWATSNGIHVG